MAGVTNKYGKQAPVGSGMVAQAARTMQNRPYQLHVQEAKAMGEQPMTPEQFMAQHQGG